MRHLVVEDILVEDIKKSDFYGSVSAVLKVCKHNILHFLCVILYSFPGTLFYQPFLFDMSVLQCCWSYLQVNEAKAYRLCSGNQAVVLRFSLFTLPLFNFAFLFLDQDISFRKFNYFFTLPSKRNLSLFLRSRNIDRSRNLKHGGSYWRLQ